MMEPLNSTGKLEQAFYMHYPNNNYYHSRDKNSSMQIIVAVQQTSKKWASKAKSLVAGNMSSHILLITERLYPLYDVCEKLFT